MQALLHLLLAAVVMAVTIVVVAFIFFWHEISDNINRPFHGSDDHDWLGANARI